VPSHMDH